MAGKRLLDAAKLFHASRSIAKQHVSCAPSSLMPIARRRRSRRLPKTRAIASQSTVRAAVALAQRMNGAPPSYFSAEPTDARSTDGRDGTEGKPSAEGTREGKPTVKVQKDAGFGSTGPLASPEAVASAQAELHVQQEQATRRPLPDGTILSTGLAADEALENGMDNAKQRHSGPLEDRSMHINQRPHESPQGPHTVEDEVPEDVNLDVFRISRGPKKNRTTKRLSLMERLREKPGVMHTRRRRSRRTLIRCRARSPDSSVSILLSPARQSTDVLTAF